MIPSNGLLVGKEANAQVKSTPVSIMVATMLISLAATYEGEAGGEIGFKRCEEASMVDRLKVLHHELILKNLSP